MTPRQSETSQSDGGDFQTVGSSLGGYGSDSQIGSQARESAPSAA
jgi:hypothetical protein